jgi:hypothetical protein
VLLEQLHLLLKLICIKLDQGTQHPPLRHLSLLALLLLLALLQGASTVLLALLEPRWLQVPPGKQAAGHASDSTAQHGMTQHSKACRHRKRSLRPFRAGQQAPLLLQLLLFQASDAVPIGRSTGAHNKPCCRQSKKLCSQTMRSTLVAGPYTAGGVLQTTITTQVLPTNSASRATYVQHAGREVPAGGHVGHLRQQCCFITLHAHNTGTDPSRWV